MSFNFHGELLEHKATAAEVLENADLSAFSDYSSIDCDHDNYGLEVEGLASQQKVNQVTQLLRKAFPNWRHINYWEEGNGFTVRISRDLEKRSRGF
jgi:hypothetical protein